MSDVLHAIGQAMRSEAEALRVVSQNIANAGTVAYRRQVPVMRAEFDALINQSAPGSALNALVPQMNVAFDQTIGTLKNTGMPTNVALEGEGFFVLQSSHGPLLTRRGDFQVGPDGVLVSADGDPVLGEHGAIQIGDGAKLKIAADGTVSIDDVAIDRLRVAVASDLRQLTSLGAGRYRLDSDHWQEGDSRSAIRQGFLETSNVAPVNEMIQMMEIVRRFESEQKFARAYDEMIGKAISELGKIG